MQESVSFNTRMPASLRERLSDLAAINGRSVNAELVARLNKSIGGGHSQAVFEALLLPTALRVRATTTSADVERILTVCSELGADQIVLAAKRDQLNGATLVMIIRTPATTCVMDGSMINLARPARVAEVQQLFQRLDALGVLSHAYASTGYAEETSELAPAAAIALLLTQPRQRLELPSFLALLGVGQTFDAVAFQLASTLPSTVNAIEGGSETR